LQCRINQGIALYLHPDIALFGDEFRLALNLEIEGDLFDDDNFRTKVQTHCIDWKEAVMKKISFILLVIVIAFSILWFYSNSSKKPFISLFPIEHYNQNLSDWIKPTDPHYEELLMTKENQEARFTEFKQRYFGDLSPWDLSSIEKLISGDSSKNIKNTVIQHLEAFSNEGKSEKELNYALNFRHTSRTWIKNLESKSNLSQFDHITPTASHRGITIAHSQARILPTQDPSFHHFSIAGEGYPFDNLQSALVWAGTPVYILGETLDKEWVLVQTPNLQAWIRRSEIALVDDNFIAQWRQAADKQLIAITETQIPIIDQEQSNFWNSGYLGMVFPGENLNQSWRIMIPVPDEQGKAHIHFALIKRNQGNAMPIPPTPHEFTHIMQQLIGRLYGWGGLYLYNDCASELKNLFTPFGIWIPMHSSDQVNPKLYPIKVVDLTTKKPEERLNYLIENGRPFMTIVYVGGHVILYLGTYPNPDDPQHKPVALTYQDVWSLKPYNPPAQKDRRAIIGRSVLLPILLTYPEDPGVASDAALKYFILGFLNSD
jgi:hypothetical protein